METVTIPFEYYHLLLDLKNAVEAVAGEYTHGEMTSQIENAYFVLDDYEADH